MSKQVQPAVSSVVNYQMKSAIETAISSTQDRLYDQLLQDEGLPRYAVLTLAVTGDAVLELIKPLARAVESAIWGSMFVVAMSLMTVDCILFTGKWQPINRCARMALIFYSDAIQKIVRFAGRALFLPLAITGQIIAIKNRKDENPITRMGEQFFIESHDSEVAEEDDFEDDSSEFIDEDEETALQSEVKGCFEEMQNELYKELRPSDDKNKDNSVGLASALPCAAADICLEGVKRLVIQVEMSCKIVLFTGMALMLAGSAEERKDDGVIALIGVFWNQATDALGQLVATVALSPLTLIAQTVQILLDPKKAKPCRIAVFNPKNLSPMFRTTDEAPKSK